MQQEEYQFILDRLNSLKDLEDLHKRAGYRKDMLYNILGRKQVKLVLKNFHRLKKKSEYFYKEWKRGMTIKKIAEKEKFSPVLMAGFILLHEGFTKTEVRGLLLNPDSIKDSSLKKEIKEVVDTDFVYAPWAADIQTKNGENAEHRLEQWLTRRGYRFLTQAQIIERGLHEKTPDFLFQKPERINGITANWIESKASFGDRDELRKHYKKQLQPYVNLFGRGIVVYWYDYLEGIEVDPNVTVVNEEFFS